MRDLLSLSAAGVRRFALAAVLVVAAMAGLAPAPASAQWFEVPQGFISVPGATTAPGSPPAVAGLEPITGIRPESGAFSDLSGIALYAVIDPVDDPDDWLRKRIALDVGDGSEAEAMLNSPDSPFDDPAFDALRKALPQLFESLNTVGELPLKFCEPPTTGYNAVGPFRELYCAFEVGPLRRFHVMRLQEAGGASASTEIHTMNERRLRHLTAIANSFHF